MPIISQRGKVSYSALPNVYLIITSAASVANDPINGTVDLKGFSSTSRAYELLALFLEKVFSLSRERADSHHTGR